MMNYKEARSLAELVVAAASWAEDVYALPLRPAEQQFPEGPYMVTLSSAFLRAEFYSLQDWIDMVRQLQPTSGPTGLPLIEQRLFDAWVRQQLARTDLNEQEQRCSTKDLSLFAHRPYLNTLCLEVPFKATIAPVVDGNDAVSQNIRTPMVPETALTVRWVCPVCTCQLSLSKRLPARLEDRLSVPGPDHSTPDSKDLCPADMWVILECDEQAGQEEEVPFPIQVWQVVRPQAALGEPHEAD
jgi:hypothetical protein